MSYVTLGYTDSTALLGDPEALRRQAAEDGYLFFRGRLPRQLVLDLRAEFLRVLDRFGWLQQGGEFMDGLVNHAAVEKEDPSAMVDQGVGIHNIAYAEIQKLEAFHEMAHHPALIEVYRALYGTEVLVHPRHIARLMLPASFNRPTPSHQDFIHIQGTRNVWTCWVPVGDCPREMGNLTVIRGSHKDGLLPVAAAQGAGGLEAHLCASDYEWIEDDFAAGDVLTFPSLTVHKSLKPQVTDRVRLSIDFRYQPANEEIEPASLRPHGGVVSWDEVYAGWKNPDIQYYWKKHTLTESAWDDSIRWQKEKIC